MSDGIAAVTPMRPNLRLLLIGERAEYRLLVRKHVEIEWPQAVIVEHRLGECVLISGIHRERAVTDHLGDRAGPRCDYRDAALHRLERGQSEPLVEGREYERECSAIERAEIFVGHITGEDDPVPESRLLREAREQRLGLPPSRADEDEQ